MDRALGKRKNLRRKYKRYAAALLSTAIMTGAALPGIPIFTKTFAAEKPLSPPVQKDAISLKAKGGWHEHKQSWPSSDDNQAWYENGHIYYLNDHHRYSHYDRDTEFVNVASPITVVKNQAAQYGFDADDDSFTIIHQGRNKATVQVIRKDTGQRFKIDLERDRGAWHMVVIRGIGDQTFPASYHSITQS